MSSNWASIASPNLVFVGIVDRAEFDKLDLPAIDHGATNPEKPVLTKTAYHGNDGRVGVCFQHWYGPTPAERETAAAMERFRAMSLTERQTHMASLLQTKRLIDEPDAGVPA